MSLLIALAILSIALTVAMTIFAALQNGGDGQSFRESIKEAWTNVAIGFGINFVANLVVLPLDGHQVTPDGAFWIGCIFTGISVCRSFVIRRWYNWRMLKSQPALPADYVVAEVSPEDIERARKAFDSVKFNI